MAHYYYFPFHNAPLDEAIEQTELTVRLKYNLGKAPETRQLKPTNPGKKYDPQEGVKTVCNVHKRADGSLGFRDAAAGQPLTKVRENDVLLVDGHGVPSGNFIASDEKSTLTLTHIELAAILILEGLNDGVVIKMLTCYSGGTWNSNADDDNIFAKKLATLIGKKKENVIVGGYPGTVINTVACAGEKKESNMTPIQLTVVNEAGDQRLTGKAAIRYYDKNGRLTQRPAASKSPR